MAQLLNNLEQIWITLCNRVEQVVEEEEVEGNKKEALFLFLKLRNLELWGHQCPLLQKGQFFIEGNTALAKVKWVAFRGEPMW
ncbi:hypothetical protein AMTR_s00002p00206390 [Amborella trichopoda]|uniref:Uncharacterized protein n=1 Tax=Amborella trichopoda TaxID=13333 RepID=W1P2F1_AMBTC|nr:hypothetical protein AMTR_s00002p00206390 [Amborella trichopoda]